MPHDDTALEREGDLHRRLERWLDSIATVSEADAVRIHLSDLYGAARKIGDLIKRLPELDVNSQRDDIRRLLARLHVELYSHAAFHLNELKPGLDAWMQRLEDEVPEEKDVEG